MNPQKIAYLIFGFIFVALLIAVLSAYANDTMLACSQADGSTIYTNKDVKGCATVTLPELSIVPDRRAQASPELPLFTRPSLSPAPTVNDKLCALYDEWMSLSEKTFGGFANNTVPDTQRRLVLVQLFGSGFTPSSCK